MVVSLVGRRVVRSAACLAFCVVASDGAAQPPRAPVNQGIARELEANRAAEVLSVPRDFLDRLRTGQLGFEGSSGPKERLKAEQLNTFVEQFGRLRNDMPTFQVDPGQYFVLIPLNELERQPVPLRAERANRLGADRALNKVQVAAKKALSERVTEDKVDHRSGQSPIRDQGQRGTCVAFASCADLEAILRKSNPATPPDLCENLAYYWYMKEEGSSPCRDPGLATFRAASYLKLHLVGDDSYWPYVGTDPDLLKADNKCSQVDDPPAQLAGKGGVGVQDFELLPTASEVAPDGSVDIKDTRTLERLLADGHNIVFGTIVAWSTPSAAGVIDVKLGPAGQPIFGAGGHAMLIVGYNRMGDAPENKPYFIVRNSWGKSYGHDGYLYLTYDYIRTYARYGYVTKTVRQGNVDLGQ